MQSQHIAITDEREAVIHRVTGWAIRSNVQEKPDLKQMVIFKIHTYIYVYMNKQFLLTENFKISNEYTFLFILGF